MGLEPGRRMLVSDVDGTLLDGPAPGRGAAELGRRLVRSDAALVLSSGRGLELSLEAAAVLEEAGLPRPSALVCGVGTEIHLWEDGRYVLDDSWRERLSASGFDRAMVSERLGSLPWLTLQPQEAQSPLKVSFDVAPANAPQDVSAELRSALSSGDGRGAGSEACRVVFSAGRFVDVLPAEASKGGALLHLVGRYRPLPRDVVVAGDSGNDRELLLTAAEAGMVAVLVRDHEPEMADVASDPRVIHSRAPHALGVLEGLLAAGW